MVILEVGCSKFDVRKRELRDHRPDSRKRSSMLETRNYKAGGTDRKRVERFQEGASGERKSTVKYGQKTAPFQKTNTKGAPRESKPVPPARPNADTTGEEIYGVCPCAAATCLLRGAMSAVARGPHR